MSDRASLDKVTRWNGIIQFGLSTHWKRQIDCEAQTHSKGTGMPRKLKSRWYMRINQKEMRNISCSSRLSNQPQTAQIHLLSLKMIMPRRSHSTMSARPKAQWGCQLPSSLRACKKNLIRPLLLSTGTITATEDITIPFGKIDGPGKWNETNLHQCHPFYF